MAAKATFDTSTKLKRLFNEQFELWQKREGLGLADLAERCGVSSSYLSHVRRYGRVPGKPVLIHLAFNFALENPQFLFDAAGIKEPWPHDSGVMLAKGDTATPGFISFKVDMKGLGGTIREIVRSELEPKNIDEQLKGRPLRMGINLDQTHFFDFDNSSRVIPPGFFREFFDLMQTALGVKVVPKVVCFTDYIKQFNSGELDLYGPIMQVPQRLAGAIYVKPMCEVAMTALWRTRGSKHLEDLAKPKTMKDFRDPRYQLAVLRGASSHDFAMGVLNRDEDSLVVCDTPEECYERAILSGVRKPVHAILVPALAEGEGVEQGLELLFTEKKPRSGYYPNTLAVRGDWPELASRINEAMGLLIRQGTIEGLFERWFEPKQLTAVRLPIG